ncbi:hybrid sensor histidine kinase/response regulator [Methylococcus sp. EFPC2]|uniref:ATP-binding response regulator n=1 Tax=Methylococcus sp. EFPC2 TaxID=2812648 RepID=UPI001967A813|nr:hybrid sensor histidine kinase/response regulator [Methylococcus sp. EFPC2]QSA97140.1 hybrid sensor histidine kinase/response regulator [Methylococcus sp. EFPC2]
MGDELGRDIEREILGELVRLHARVLTRLPYVQLLLVVGLFLLVFRHVAIPSFMAWAASAVLGECLRGAYGKALLERGEALDPQAAHRRLILLAGMVGGIIGSGGALFLAKIPLPEQALLTIILFAMPAAGVSVAASSRPILAAYSLFILAPVSLAWISLHPHQVAVVGGLAALYWLFIISVAADGEQLLRRSVAIRRERDRVVKDLERSNSEVRSAVARAEQSSKARARVLAAASHDLRQPLHALSIYSAVLSANPAPGALPEIARNIDRLVRNLGGLLHGLLDLSRLSAEHYAPERQAFFLNAVVADICTEYARAAAEKGLRLVCELEPVRLRDDPLAAARIARNLLDNAIKYTESGEVRVSTLRRGAAGILRVADTGKGIPPDEQARVFEEFYQLDNPGRDHGKGVGLGLAIVQRLCELIGAEISLASGSDEGACFSVSFPTVDPESDDKPATETHTFSVRLRGKRIYVLDDEPDILESMSGLLSTWEAQVETADSVETAEALFHRAGAPHLLIVDLRLRGTEDGATLASRLQDRHGRFPVLVITGETAPESLQKSRERGYPLLQKPINRDVLQEALSVVVAE